MTELSEEKPMYMILTGTSTIELTRKVNDVVQDQYTPYGSMVVSDSSQGPLFCQPMLYSAQIFLVSVLM